MRQARFQAPGESDTKRCPALSPPWPRLLLSISLLHLPLLYPFGGIRCHHPHGTHRNQGFQLSPAPPCSPTGTPGQAFQHQPVSSALKPHGPVLWGLGWEVLQGREGWGRPDPALLLPQQTSCLQYLDARNTPLLDHSAPFVARALRIRSSLAVLHLENASLSGRPLMLLGEPQAREAAW